MKLSPLCAVILLCTLGLVILTPADNAAESASVDKAKLHPPSGVSISVADLQEFDAARMAALKAHPDLAEKASQLSEKLSLFDQKLSAAMLATDPKIGPTLSNFGYGAQEPISGRSGERGNSGH